jgi:hypothetical protein
LQNQRQEHLHARGIAWLRNPRGDFHLGATRDRRNVLNGNISQVGYGPGQVGKNTWRAMLEDRNIMPSMYDADVLDAALLEINRVGDSETLILPTLAELF